VTLRTEALRELSAWAAPTPDQVAMRGAYLDYLAAHEDAMWRRCEPGHLTASALVIASDGDRVLLTLHPKVGRWLQTGGHCESGDRTLADAALREATEETGIAGLELRDQPIRLDRHRVHCRPDGDSEHLDVQYLALAPTGALETITEESLALRWWPVRDLPDSVDASVRALVSRAVTLVS
jgi:8-oxo-dGTP pyrophosphatase MutT (NUDIX family)